MRQLLILLILVYNTTFAQTKADCINEGLTILKKNYPRGLHILTRLNPKTRKHLEGMMHCDRNRNTLILSLETVVHESVHFFNAQKSNAAGQGFYLTNDSTVFATLSESSLEAIRSRKVNLIYNSLSEAEQTDMAYAETYLQGDIGNQDFFTLLDELDAYTYGLDAAIHLPRLSSGTSHSALAGPLAMTTFILRYYEYFEKTNADYFQNVLMGKALLPVVKLLITRALAKVKEGRSISDLQANVETWEQILRSDEHKRMMKVILG